MSRLQLIPGLAFLESEPLRAAALREEPDWVLVERITGKKCPETVNLRSLSRMTETELVRTLGLSDTQGKKLSAALTLAERLAHEGIERGQEIRTGKDVFQIFAGQMRDAKKESFCAVTLDQKHKVIDIHRISEGTLSMTPVHPREAFNPVIRDHAEAVIFVHNHPSGNPEPSPDDFHLTERLAEAGTLLGIRVLDHVVIGNRAYVSLRDRGAIREEGMANQAAESGYARGARDSSGEYGKESFPSPSGRNTKETSLERQKEQGPDFTVKDPLDNRLTFRLGPKNLEHSEVTLTGEDWKGMIENAGKGDTWHLLAKTEDGLSRLEGSFKNTDSGRIEALKERSRREDMSGDGRTPRFVVIAHEHFERAFPEMRKQAAENSRKEASPVRTAGQEAPARSSASVRRERGGMGF